MAAQIAGNTIGNILEVEAATHAARVTLRPEDYGALGIYSVANSNGATQMSAGIASGSTIFSFRWGNAANLALIKRVRLSAGNGRYGVHSWQLDVPLAGGAVVQRVRYRRAVAGSIG
jgi:hypothetical protein